MKNTLETRDSAFEEILDAGLSEDELLNTPYAYERFASEETSALRAILLGTLKTMRILNWHQTIVNQNPIVAFIQASRSQPVRA